LASGSGDNSIKVWNLAEKREEFQFQGHSHAVRSLAFSPYGKLLARGSDDDDTITVYEISSPLFEFQEVYSSPCLNLISMTDFGYQNYIKFNNACCMISHSRWIEITSWDVTISNLKFTPLHFAAYTGETTAVQKALFSQN
jgi:WD40 repeat protein